MKPTKADIRKWVKALRGGKYKQTKSALQNDEGYCCLGIACVITIPEDKRDVTEDLFLAGEFPNEQASAPDWLTEIDSNFEEVTGVTLSDLNDEGLSRKRQDELMDFDSYADEPSANEILSSFTFDEIADALEAVYIHEVLA